MPKDEKVLKEFYFPELNLYCEADFSEMPKIEKKFIEKLESDGSKVYEVKRVVIKVKKCVKLLDLQLDEKNERDKNIKKDLKSRRDKDINPKVDKMYLFIDLEKKEKDIDDPSIEFEERKNIINARIQTLKNEIEKYKLQKNQSMIDLKQKELERMNDLREKHDISYTKAVKSQLFDKQNE